MEPWREELYHHGIVGQKWGKRNGPPYPLKGGSYSDKEIEEISKEREHKPNSVYNKKHFDENLKEGTKFYTYSYNKNRTKDTDMYYAVHKYGDKHMYNVVFNNPVPKNMKDDDGNNIGNGMYCKFLITNKAIKDVKIASEDSGAEAFLKLYKNDRDFYNFVTDKNRMRDYFSKERYGHKGYQEAREVLEKMDVRTKKLPTKNELKKVYRMFNYVIPYDGAGNKEKGNDVKRQRAKFFSELKKRGYSGVLDTNDSIYNRQHANSSVIVFDMDSIISDKVKRTNITSKFYSAHVMSGKKLLDMI